MRGSDLPKCNAPAAREQVLRRIDAADVRPAAGPPAMLDSPLVVGIKVL